MTRTDMTGGACVSAIETFIGGTACASCAARIEKALNRISGVAANVHHALGSAQACHAEAVSVEELIVTIPDAGYTATRPGLPGEAADARRRRSPPVGRFNPVLAGSATTFSSISVVSNWLRLWPFTAGSQPAISALEGRSPAGAGRDVLLAARN